MGERVRSAGIAAATILSAALVAGGAPAVVAQDAGDGDRQQVRYEFTTTTPGSPTGNLLELVFVNPADPAAKPPSVARIVIEAPPGTTIDTAVAERCRASDAELIAQGASACPVASRVGEGELITDTGSPGLVPRFGINALTNFNGEEELIGLAESTEPPTRVVSRSKIEGRTVTIEVPALPGAPPPDPFLAFKSLKVAGGAVVSGDRAAMRTPPSCPAQRHWIAALTFTYRDGVVQREEVAVPCSPAVAEPSRARCHGRRATIVGTRNGEVIAGTPRRDVIAARGGDDRIRARGGDDRICAGGGSDAVRAGAGDDHIRGGRGRDRIIPGPGRDFVIR